MDWEEQFGHQGRLNLFVFRLCLLNKWSFESYRRYFLAFYKGSAQNGGVINFLFFFFLIKVFSIKLQYQGDYYERVLSSQQYRHILREFWQFAITSHFVSPKMHWWIQVARLVCPLGMLHLDQLASGNHKTKESWSLYVATLSIKKLWSRNLNIALWLINSANALTLDFSMTPCRQSK